MNSRSTREVGREEKKDNRSSFYVHILAYMVVLDFAIFYRRDCPYTYVWLEMSSTYLLREEMDTFSIAS
jgi:hypothetical protein